MREAITHIKYFCHLFDIKKMHAARTKQLTISLPIDNMRAASTHIKLLIIFFDNQENACIKHAYRNFHHFFANRKYACSRHAYKTTHHFF